MTRRDRGLVVMAAECLLSVARGAALVAQPASLDSWPGLRLFDPWIATIAARGIVMLDSLSSIVTTSTPLGEVRDVTFYSVAVVIAVGAMQ